MRPWSLRNLVRKVDGEEAPRVVVAVAIIGFSVQAVRNDAAVLAHGVQGVSPSERVLRGESVPRLELERCLECVVVGCAHTLKLDDGAGISACGRHVKHHAELPPQIANVSNLPDGGVAEGLLNLQARAVKVGCTELL